MEKIMYNGRLFAIIVRAYYHKEGVSFFTEPGLSQQLAYMAHPVGHIIPPHEHRLIKREVSYTQEVLVIRKGKLRVDLYNNEHTRIKSLIIESGDVILLVSGGHGFEVLENVEMFEIKQGPYVGQNDKKFLLNN